MVDGKTSSLSEQLITLIRGKPVTNNDLEQAALFVLDGIANAIGGQNSIPGQKLLTWQQSQGDDAGRLAFVMGGLTHILEVDDLHRASVVHPGCVVIPAAYSIGRRENSDGKSFLTAVLHGFEAACRVGMAVGPAHYTVWHNTATCGPYGAAVAAAHLLNLDQSQTVHAFGNAGSQSSGFWEFLDTGAMTKHLHAGRAAESGVIAADLAALGFTGPPKILEGKKGFFAGACPDAIPKNITAGANESWQLLQTSIKPWPCCRHTHAIIDAALTLREQLAGEEIELAIEHIEIRTYQAAVDVCDRPNPDSEYEAKFSLYHTAAIALLVGEVGFESFDKQARTLSDNLRQRIKVIVDSKVHKAYPAAFGGELTIHLRNGEKLTLYRQNAKGDPEAPLSRLDMIAKADFLLRHGGVSEPAAFIEAILATAQGAPLPELPFCQNTDSAR